MKFTAPIQWLSNLFKAERKTDKLRLLQQQRLLLQQGLEATAEVIDAAFFEDKIGSMLPVKIWIKLKRNDGSYIYTHSQTLVTLNHLPHKGQMLRIKYFPDNLSAILIM